MAPARNSQLSMSTQKKQASISSFFTPKTNAPKAHVDQPTHPEPTSSTAEPDTSHDRDERYDEAKESLFVPETMNTTGVGSRKTSTSSNLSKRNRDSEHGLSDLENIEPASKKVKIWQDFNGDKAKSPGNDHEKERSRTIGISSVSRRTLKYVFPGSPMAANAGGVEMQEEEVTTEASRQKKEMLHRRFVQKLGRPDAIAEIKRRNHHVTEETEAMTGADEENGDEMEDEPVPTKKTGPGKPKGGARANGKLTPMEVQYLEIKKHHLDTVIVFEVGYKFRFFGEDARIASKELGIVCIPGKMRYDNHASEAHLDRFASASFPVARLHVHVKRLVSAGHKVGVVRQLETAALKSVGDNRNAPFVRKMTNVYTKGTYVDDLEGLEGSVTAPAGVTSTGYLICLTESNARGYGNDEKVHVGFIAVQPTTGSIIYDDFEDGFMRSEIETRLLHIAPCEYLIVGELSDATEKLVKHLSGTRSNVFGDQARIERVEKEKSVAAQAYSHASRFYAEKLSPSTEAGEDKANVLDQVHQLTEHVTICLSAMIKHLTEYGLEHILGLTKNFQPFSARTHMLLNGNTLTSLEIYKNQFDHTEKGSLFWTLDRTRTRFGRRLLRSWVGRPLLDKAKLEGRIRAVEELMNGEHASQKDRLDTMLASIKGDLEKILVRIYYQKASRSELLGFLQAMQRVSASFGHVENASSIGFESEILNQAIAQLPTIGDDVIGFLNRINTQAAKEDDKFSFFLEAYETAEITTHKLGIDSVEQELDGFKATASKILGRAKIEYVTSSAIEYLIEVENTSASQKKVPASWAKISGTKKLSRFHPPEVVKMLKKRELHKESLAKACDDAFMDLLSEVSALYQPLRDCIQAMANLDCLLSLAEVAARPGYCKPSFVTGGRINVRQGRHPMVEQILLDTYVPNDIVLSNRQDGGSDDISALLITGPNMGGKSSYVRSVALIAIMGQIGSYVPAEVAELGMLDAVFTRMGAFDNMMRGESTFMVELGETSDILKQATDRSLVILDELGRGTSTHDGVAIAEAVLRELLERQVMTLFITHYQDMSRLQTICKGLQNVHVKFQESVGPDGEEEVTFLYEVCEGVAHRSYGLNVARMALVPQGVIEVAKFKSKEFEDAIERKKVMKAANILEMIASDGSVSADAFDQLTTAIKQL